MGLLASSAPAAANHDVFGRVSAGEVNGNGNNISTFQGASADGSRIFFETNEPLVPGDTDIFEDVYQRSGGTTTKVSPGSTPDNALFDDASADGSRVVFSTSAKLAPTDTDPYFDLYERAGGVTTHVSRGAVNGSGNFVILFAGASTDGSRIFFVTEEALVALRPRYDPRRLRTVGRDDEVGIRRPDPERQRRPRGGVRGRVRRRLRRLLQHSRAAGRKRRRQRVRHLQARRRDDRSRLPRTGRRQRRLLCLGAPGFRRREPCFLHDERGARRAPIPMPRRTSTSARPQGRSSSPPARSTATEPSTFPGAARRRTAAGPTSTRRSSSRPTTPTRAPTSTSGPAGRRRRSRRARSTAMRRTRHSSPRSTTTDRGSSSSAASSSASPTSTAPSTSTSARTGRPSTSRPAT